jgi:hypothetical protein
MGSPEMPGLFSFQTESREPPDTPPERPEVPRLDRGGLPRPAPTLFIGHFREGPTRQVGK